MSIAEENAWAAALATKYGIREPLAPDDIPPGLAASLALGECHEWMTSGTSPLTSTTR